MAGYSYLTLEQLRSELLQRLQDPSAQFTTVPEANIYIHEALRVLNAQTYAWNANYQFDFAVGDKWKSLNVAGSPRERTITDADLLTQMEAMLLEPMSGSVWTGTNQFNIGLLSAALQYRRDELLLECAANMVNWTYPSPTGSMRTPLPDSTLDVMRVRWIQADTTSGSPYVLGREDIGTVNAFSPRSGVEPGWPDSWVITSNPPLSFDVSCPVSEPGAWDTLLSFAGVAFNPPTAALVGLPDDWAWVCLYGALADVLATAPEGRDSTRSKYCLSRYEQGKKAMRELPWLIQATVGSVSVDTPSHIEMDSWDQNWEQNHEPSDPLVVVGGMDLVALAPNPTTDTVSSVLTLVGNAPVPTSDSSQIQLSRDGVDAVLAYAQHLSTFKRGGDDFLQTIPLLEQFEAYCRAKNSEYAALGIYRPDLLVQGVRNDVLDPRFIEAGSNG